MAELDELDMSDNAIKEDGACALAASPYLNKLTSLDVNRDTIGKKGEAALLKRFGEDVVYLS